MIKKFISIVFTGVFAAGVCFAASNAKDLVSEKYWDELVQNSEVKIIHDEEDLETVLFPKSEERKIFDDHRIEQRKKGVPFFLEYLYLLDKQQLLESCNSDDTEINLDDVSRIFRSVSKMEGMKYYSQRQKKETVLYEHAYTIASADDTTPIADINTGNADGQVSYSFQEDNSFGPCRYELHYWQNDDMVYAIFNNLDPYKLYGFTGILGENLNITVVGYDCGDQLLLYLAADVSAQKVPGVRKQITDSMTARIDAIANWFKKQF